MAISKRLLGLGVLLCCALLWFFIIPDQTESPKAEEFPKIIVLFLVIPGLILLLRPYAPAPGADISKEQKTAFLYTGALLGLVTLYLCAVPVVGFYASSFVAQTAFLFLLGERKAASVVLVPLAVTGLLYCALSYGLSYQMPSGWLP